MSNRFSRWATGLIAVTALALITGKAWAVYYALGTSKDEWGLKYEVAFEDAGVDTLTIKFTLVDEGRLKPIHSITLAVLDKQYSSPGSSTYSVKGRIELKPTGDGKRVGQIQVRKEEADQAIIRVLTQRVDGKFQSAGAAYYDISLAKHLKDAATPGMAARPKSPSANGKK